MAVLVNPYNGKAVNVPDDSVATFKERGFVDLPEPAKPRPRRQRTTKTEE